ncbi:MAG: hypothetical protein Q8P02_04260 [Candidatus Micrarchaeota archaeon]|nr:hypothetical protein [Candidatus Micrarchaeota archaeon]
MMATLSQIQKRVRNTKTGDWVVTEYFRKQADFRRVEPEQAIANIQNRADAVWRFSQHRGIKGQRIEIFVRVSRLKTHDYVVEANDGIYLVNVIVIDGKKQGKLKRYENR